MLDPLRHVKFFATIKHGDQKYGNLPYTHHLEAVEMVLRRFGAKITVDESRRVVEDEDYAQLTAAWLHDVCEDKGIKRKEIAEMFGERVADLVFAVTKGRDGNRETKAALNYPKIRECVNAVRLKLADRIANVEQGGALVAMYAKEHESFRRALYTSGEFEDMWHHLNGILGMA